MVRFLGAKRQVFGHHSQDDGRKTGQATKKA